MLLEMRKIFLFGGFVIGTEAIWQLYKIIRHYRKCKSCVISEKKEKEEDLAEVMFFSERSSVCRDDMITDHSCFGKHCPVQHLRNIYIGEQPFSQLESYINAAKNSLDVCMYLMTAQTLSKAFVDAWKRGVHVRVIMDRHMAYNDAAQAAPFHKNGIEVRMQLTDVLMHHKFVIVDERILITGSSNWTMSAFFGNYDNVLVTNKLSFVQPFVESFQTMWCQFQPYEDTKPDETAS